MKNKTCFLIVIFLITNYNFSIAQKPKDIYLGVNLSLDHSTYTPASGSLFITGMNNINNLQFSYTAGASVLFQRTNHFGIQIGINFKDALTQFSSTLILIESLNPSPLYAPNGSATIIDHTRLLEFPVKVCANFGNKKIKFITSIGLVTGIILNNYTINDITYNEGSTFQQSYYRDKFSGDQRLYFNLFFSAGISYQLNEKYLLKIEPTDVFYLDSRQFSGGSPFSFNTHIFGLNFTVLRKM